ncbi:MAG: DUF1559 domain-containing protein [Planctomycetaceae bacterium]|nr:DUF1559 domain-containing protein [Planctomycetaceae bacterium]
MRVLKKALDFMLCAAGSSGGGGGASGGGGDGSGRLAFWLCRILRGIARFLNTFLLFPFWKKTSFVRRAFTLVELLVVIAVIGVLISLLLPAVQAAREAARRMQCTNHIKQIVLGVHNFESARNEMPLGMYSAPDAEVGGSEPAALDEGFSFLAMLLPYVEQAPLYDQLRPGERYQTWLKAYQSSNDAGKIAMKGVFTQHHDAEGTIMPGGDAVISYFRCPSSILPSHAPASFDLPGYENRALETNIVGYATSDYKGCGGSDGPEMDEVGGDNGVLMKQAESKSPIRFSQITDGLSNTFMIGESSYVPGGKKASDNINDYPTWIGGQYNDEQVRITGEIVAVINLGPYKKTWWVDDGAGKNAVSDDAAYSQHVGGANFGLCDGSVRFVSENISQSTYNWLHGRDDGKPLGSF